MSVAVPDRYAPVLRDPDAFMEAAVRRSLIAFAQRVDPGYRPARHHRIIARALERAAREGNARIVISIAPRHGKSQLASVFFPAWYLGNFPDRKIMACSYTAHLAYRFSRQARNLLADPRWPFPEVAPARDLRNVSAWGIEGRRGGYVAAGVGGSVTGFGASLLAIDDPVKSREEADSPVLRERAWEWFTGTALTRVEAGGSVVIIGTRWQQDDLIGRALQMDGVDWEEIILPAICEDENDPCGREVGEALWPEMYPLAWLERQRTMISEREFVAQYQCRPSPAGGSVFHRDWWGRWSSEPRVAAAAIAVDSAFKDGAASDFSVAQLWGASGLGDYLLLDQFRGRVQFPELLRAVHDLHAAARARLPHLAVPVVVEDAASGQSAIQVLKRPLPTGDGGLLPALPVVPWKVAGQSKVARAESVSPLVEAGRVLIPASAPWVGAFVEEASAFPAAAHDDQVDAMAMALAYLSRPRARGATSF